MILIFIFIYYYGLALYKSNNSTIKAFLSQQAICKAIPLELTSFI